MNLSGSCTYLVGGEKRTLSTMNMTLGASYGPARLTIEAGQLTAVRALEKIKNPDAITQLGVTRDGESWRFSDDCDVVPVCGQQLPAITMRIPVMATISVLLSRRQSERAENENASRVGTHFCVCGRKK